MMANDFAAHVKSSLSDTSVPLWFPDLTANLVESAWQKLGRELDLNQDTYSTARVLTQDPSGPRQVVSCLPIPSLDGAVSDAIPVELLPDGLARDYAGSDMRFFPKEEIVEGGVLHNVEGAVIILARVPTLLPTLCSLIRALHLIDSQDDEIDVSFSEPDLPFSVFVSVPGPEAEAAELRVAEGLLHESMHLQLTLVESFVPLVEPGERTYFSPWRNEFRTPQGVLHALYVFRVIDAFLGLIADEGSLCVATLSHIQARQETIARQVQEIHRFRECSDLTVEGSAFAERLLR